MHCKTLLYPDGRNRALTLSYDDGRVFDRRLIDMMKEYEIRGTFNLNGVRYGGEKNDAFIGADELNAVYDPAYCEIATHAYTHPHLDRIPTSACMEEILSDRRTFETLTGRIVRGHAYPYGTYNDRVVGILRDAGIVYARTTVSHHAFFLPEEWLLWGATCHHNDPKLDELADRFLDGTFRRNEDGRLFYLWGHSYEFDALNNWDRIEAFFRKVGGRDDVWYATNLQIYEYVEAYRALVSTADGNTLYNPTRTDVWARINERTVKIAAGETVTV